MSCHLVSGHFFSFLFFYTSFHQILTPARPYDDLHMLSAFAGVFDVRSYLHLSEKCMTMATKHLLCLLNCVAHFCQWIIMNNLSCIVKYMIWAHRMIPLTVLVLPADLWSLSTRWLLSTLFNIASVMLVSSIPCERGSSIQNHMMQNVVTSPWSSSCCHTADMELYLENKNWCSHIWQFVK